MRCIQVENLNIILIMLSSSVDKVKSRTSWGTFGPIHTDPDEKVFSSRRASSKIWTNRTHWRSRIDIQTRPSRFVPIFQIMRYGRVKAYKSPERSCENIQVSGKVLWKHTCLRSYKFLANNCCLLCSPLLLTFYTRLSLEKKTKIILEQRLNFVLKEIENDVTVYIPPVKNYCIVAYFGYNESPEPRCKNGQMTTSHKIDFRLRWTKAHPSVIASSRRLESRPWFVL